MDADAIIRFEADLIRCSDPNLVLGRALRLHISGDCPGTVAASVLSNAAWWWLDHGGLPVWGYSHNWVRILSGAWGPISMLASVDSVDDGPAAISARYMPAVIMPTIIRKPWSKHGIKWRPCPAQIGDATCVSCRLCWKHRPRTGIVFFPHGGAVSKNRAIETARSLTGAQLPLFEGEDR